jgi:hypothetical protein
VSALTAAQIAVLESLNVPDFRDTEAMATFGGLNPDQFGTFWERAAHAAAQALVGKGLAEQGTTTLGAGYRLTPGGFRLVEAISIARDHAEGIEPWSWEDVSEVTGIPVHQLSGTGGPATGAPTGAPVTAEQARKIQAVYAATCIVSAATDAGGAMQAVKVAVSALGECDPEFWESADPADILADVESIERLLRNLDRAAYRYTRED